MAGFFKRSIKTVPMEGILRESPYPLIYFIGPYQATAQGVDSLLPEQREPHQILSLVAVSFEKLGRFLAEWKI